MIKVNDIPAYVLDPSYKMTHIIAAKRKDGSLQYRQCFGSKGAATKRMKVSKDRFPDVEFYMFSINELN
jgi:hypothetical protein